MNDDVFYLPCILYTFQYCTNMSYKWNFNYFSNITLCLYCVTFVSEDYRANTLIEVECGCLHHCMEMDYDVTQSQGLLSSHYAATYFQDKIGLNESADRYRYVGDNLTPTLISTRALCQTMYDSFKMGK